MAALPSGLAAELPRAVADATPALQFSDTSSWVTAVPLLFAGGCTVRCCVRVTTQLGHASWSPTVDCTTGVKPAPVIAVCASEYFCPVTLGGEPATATPLPVRASAAPAAAVGLTPRTKRRQRISRPLRVALPRRPQGPTGV